MAARNEGSRTDSPTTTLLRSSIPHLKKAARKVITWVGSSPRLQMLWRPTDRLFEACVRTVLFSLAIAFLAYLVIRFIAPVDGSKALDPQYPIQFALWIAGGVGGVVALVVAYRRQKVTEASIFVERFGAAAAQLGAVDPAVRLAGVYAMVGVADEGTSSQRQQCVDVLCGYLRLPYSAASDSMGTTQQVVKKPGLTLNSPSTEITITYRLHDKEVRAAIVRSLAQHLHKDRDPRSSWSSCSIDISGAVLGTVDFAHCNFGGPITAQETTFTGPAGFTGATFTGETNFRWATFTGPVDYTGATFTGPVGFAGATFTREASFAQAMFAGEANSSRWADFTEATFTGRADFGGATFTRWADFTGATFTQRADFDRATFTWVADFEDATFTREGNFDGATFTERADFAGATFTESAGFIRATFTGRADFRWATFTETASFIKATFTERVDFDRVKFAERANFTETTFTRWAGFTGATFTGPVDFTGATFAGPVDFTGATFTGGANFGRAMLSSDKTIRSNFARVGYGSGEVSFLGADFGAGEVSFSDPRTWAPSPKFDWDANPSLKPSNVLPVEWPPTVSEQE